MFICSATKRTRRTCRCRCYQWFNSMLTSTVLFFFIHETMFITIFTGRYRNLCCDMVTCMEYQWRWIGNSKYLCRQSWSNATNIMCSIQPNSWMGFTKCHNDRFNRRSSTGELQYSWLNSLCCIFQSLWINYPSIPVCIHALYFLQWFFTRIYVAMCTLSLF